MQTHRDSREREKQMANKQEQRSDTAEDSDYNDCDQCGQRLVEEIDYDFICHRCADAGNEHGDAFGYCDLCGTDQFVYPLSDEQQAELEQQDQEGVQYVCRECGEDYGVYGPSKLWSPERWAAHNNKDRV
jgi:predicted RNA-binding Zn-ribbon protein involved in translation (DUF1610 family)